MQQTASEARLGAGSMAGDIMPWAVCHIPRERGVRLPATSSAACAAATHPRNLEASSRQLGYPSFEQKGPRHLRPTTHLQTQSQPSLRQILASSALKNQEAKTTLVQPCPFPLEWAMETKPTAASQVSGSIWEDRGDKSPLMKSL